MKRKFEKIFKIRDRADDILDKALISFTRLWQRFTLASFRNIFARPRLHNTDIYVIFRLKLFARIYLKSRDLFRFTG